MSFRTGRSRYSITDRDPVCISTTACIPGVIGRSPAVSPDVELSRDQVAAALIRYCSAIYVPLPRGAQKVLQPADDGIYLLINIEGGKGTPEI